MCWRRHGTLQNSWGRTQQNKSRLFLEFLCFMSVKVSFGIYNLMLCSTTSGLVGFSRFTDSSWFSLIETCSSSSPTGTYATSSSSPTTIYAMSSSSPTRTYAISSSSPTQTYAPVSKVLNRQNPPQSHENPLWDHKNGAWHLILTPIFNIWSLS